jgi:hypothetical protein
MQNSEVVLLDIDPEHIHVFWHFDRDPAVSTYIIRLHDLAWMDMSGANPHAAFDWHVTSARACAYLHIPGGGRCLRIELGQRGAYRRLDVLAHSHVVQLPPLRGARFGPPQLLHGALLPEEIMSDILALTPQPIALPFPIVPPSSWGTLPLCA